MQISILVRKPAGPLEALFGHIALGLAEPSTADAAARWATRGAVMVQSGSEHGNGSQRTKLNPQRPAPRGVQTRKQFAGGMLGFTTEKRFIVPGIDVDVDVVNTQHVHHLLKA